ncbi:MAG: cache domain-containing protein, partial [Planctomycetota bacterium]|nr:cache domain-containing protein [Planctomycetota bacterium]
MKIRNQILVPVVTATAIALLIAFVVLDFVFRNETSRNLTEATSAQIDGIHEHEQQVTAQCLTLASLFSRAPVVQRAFAMAHEGSIEAENDEHAAKARKLLLAELGPFAEGYSAAMDGRSFRMHFHLPSGRSLLRLWKAKQNTSDDLSGFRQTVLDINRGNHEPITGIEVGRGGFAIRGIAAVTAPDGRHLGSVEVLSDYLP